MHLQKAFGQLFVFRLDEILSWESLCAYMCISLPFSEEGLKYVCVCLPVSVYVCFYERVWLAKKALVSPQVGLVQSGQRRVS